MTPTTGRRTHTPRLRQDALLNQLLGHRAEFIRFLSSRVGETAAEDILQSAYMKALEKGTQINETESAVAWFYRILRNSTIDHYRRIAARGRAHEQLAAEAPISYETELGWYWSALIWEASR